MKRSDFLKSLGLGTAGLILPKDLLHKTQTKIYDNYIRGLHHYDYEKIKHHLKEGEQLTLKRDEENQYDAFAVLVLYNEHKLGYLPAYENIVIANMLDANVELTSYISAHKTDKGNYRSVGIEVFVELITPTPQLITELQNKRADQVTDIYRKGYKL